MTLNSVLGEPKSPSALEVVLSFVDGINQGDVDAIVGLMTPDHLFVDSLGNVLRGTKPLRQAWHAYFGIVPDYRITAQETVQAGEVVALFGITEGTYSVDGHLAKKTKWEAPAAWKAVVQDGKVAEWRVYADNEQIREIMRLAKKGGKA